MERGLPPNGADVCLAVFALAIWLHPFPVFLLTAIVAVGCFYRLYRLQFSGLSAIFTTHFEVCFVCHKTNE